MLDIPAVMKALAVRRPIFHSEADFQHALALLLRERMPSMDIRLEYPLGGVANGAVDIVVRSSGQAFAIELKYLCQQVTTSVGAGEFVLRPQGAQDIRRYDVLKDVERMERFVQIMSASEAGVIVLTNELARVSRTV